MLGSVTGKNRGPQPAVSAKLRRGGFTLVELLAVVVIMAIVFGLLAVSITQTRGPAVQVASAQVASGLSLARQIAISKNTHARFIIAHTNGINLPEEPFRFWTVVSSNRGKNTWRMEKEWEPLPAGVVFQAITGKAYNTLNWDAMDPKQIGVPYKPEIRAVQTGSGLEWKTFESFSSVPLKLTFASGNTGTMPENTPYIGFKSDGKASFSSGANVNSRAGGIRLAEGVVQANEIIVQSENNACYVETETLLGKILVRPRDSYK